MPVLPFAALAPRGFYDSLIVAQVGPRAGVQRVPVLTRLQEMAGLSYAHFPLRLGTIHLPGHTAIVLTAAAVVLLTTGGLAVAALASHARPEPLDWFAVVTLALVVAVFLWPSQFHYHFCAFLAPFLGLAIALPLATLAAAMTGSPARPAAGPGWPARAVAAVAAVILGVCTAAGFAAENALRPDVSPATIAAAARRIPARVLRGHRRGVPDPAGRQVHRPGARMFAGARRARHRPGPVRRAETGHRGGPGSRRGGGVVAGVPKCPVRLAVPAEPPPDRLDPRAAGLLPQPLHPGAHRPPR